MPLTRNQLVGRRVRRGPDWAEAFQNQDGGAGCLGTVMAPISPSGPTDYDSDFGWVQVKWDTGNCQNSYRWHCDGGKIDLIVVSDPTTTPQTSPEDLLHRDIATLIGEQVVRGRHWTGGDHDGGKGRVGTIIAVKGISRVQVRWPTGYVGQYLWNPSTVTFQVELLDVRTRAFADMASLPTGALSASGKSMLLGMAYGMKPDHVAKMFAFKADEPAAPPPRDMSSGPIEVETRTFINQRLIDNFTDTEVLDLIQQEERDIKALSELTVKPKCLQEKLDKRKEALKAMVAALDARDAAKK